MNEHALLYQHSNRPAWGYGAIEEVLEDRTRFKFDDGSRRSISHGHIHLMHQVELTESEASEVRKRIGKLAPLGPAGVDVKPKSKGKSKRSAKKSSALP